VDYVSPCSVTARSYSVRGGGRHESAACMPFLNLVRLKFIVRGVISIMFDFILLLARKIKDTLLCIQDDTSFLPVHWGP
jgi:hypothetical protein